MADDLTILNQQPWDIKEHNYWTSTVLWGYNPRHLLATASKFHKDSLLFEEPKSRAKVDMKNN